MNKNMKTTKKIILFICIFVVSFILLIYSFYYFILRNTDETYNGDVISFSDDDIKKTCAALTVNAPLLREAARRELMVWKKEFENDIRVKEYVKPEYYKFDINRVKDKVNKINKCLKNHPL